MSVLSSSFFSGKYWTALAAAALLAGCVGAGEKRLSTARAVADPAQLSHRTVTTDGFTLTVFEKIAAPGTAATVYIEGDGRAFSRARPTADPSPVNPVGLRLAAADQSAAVIYIARPCQYSGGDTCAQAFWTTRRFAPEIVSAIDHAITQIMTQHQLSGVRLVGFSGGGAIAALLAARRGDVIDLRTVAGNLDHRMHSAIHKVAALAGSLNAADEAARLRTVPQYHFIGEKDDIVPQAVYDSYAQALGASPCLHSRIVPGMAHGEEWAAAWRSLQTLTPDCGRE